MRKLEKITRGKNDCNVHISMTVDTELVYEEFVDALVKTSALKSSAKTKPQAFDHLITHYLTKCPS